MTYDPFYVVAPDIDPAHTLPAYRRMRPRASFRRMRRMLGFGA